MKKGIVIGILVILMLVLVIYFVNLYSLEDETNNDGIDSFDNISESEFTNLETSEDVFNEIDLAVNVLS
jgi:hypothetical protein